MLELKPKIKHIYTTEYSQCTDVLCKDSGEWIEVVLPLKSNNSTNASLINQWLKTQDQGWLKVGKVVKILTWLDKSKNGNPIRRFRLVI